MYKFTVLCLLRAILNKSWRQHLTRHQLYGHQPPTTKTIQVRRARHAVHCWRSRDELISGILLWTLIYGLAKAGRPARTYIQQLCQDTACGSEDLPEAMNDDFKPIHLTNRWNLNTTTTAPDQSGSESNVNEGISQNSQRYRIGASPFDAV